MCNGRGEAWLAGCLLTLVLVACSSAAAPVPAPGAAPTASQQRAAPAAPAPAAAAPAPTPAPVTVTVGRAAVSGSLAPLWLAQELGYFAKYGLAVQETVMRSAGAVEAALFSNEIQFGYTGLPAALSARASGADVALIAVPSDKALSELIVRPDIRQPTDLRGRIMGVQSIGGTIHVRGLLALQALGLDVERDRIQVIVAGDDPTLVQGVVAGSVDAAPVSYSGARVAREQGMLGWDLAELGVPEIGLCVVVTGETLRERSDLAERFVKSIAEAIHFMRQNRSDPAQHARVLQIVATRLQLTPEQVAPEVDRLAEIALPNLTADPTAAARVQALLAQSVPAVAQVPLDAVIDQRVVRKLEAEGYFAQLGR